MKSIPAYRWMSLWRHFLDRERSADQLTASMADWQEKWNWDFLKINPPACYHVLDWGADYEFFSDPEKEPVLRKPADLNQVSSLDVTKGMLGEQIQVIRNLRARFGPELPIVETVFAPLEIAPRLGPGREAFRGLVRSNPREAHRLLKIITGVFSDFCLACVDAGADGIFFATKWATSDWLTWQEYEEFGRKYDAGVLQGLKDREALIILHVCGARTYLEKMLDYPADIFSYDFFADGATPPETVASQTGRFVLGGVDPGRLLTNHEEVVEDCRRLSRIDSWLIGPSCVLSPRTPDEAIAALIRAL